MSHLLTPMRNHPKMLFIQGQNQEARNPWRGLRKIIEKMCPHRGKNHPTSFPQRKRLIPKKKLVDLSTKYAQGLRCWGLFAQKIVSHRTKVVNQEESGSEVLKRSMKSRKGPCIPLKMSKVILLYRKRKKGRKKEKSDRNLRKHQYLWWTRKRNQIKTREQKQVPTNLVLGRGFWINR